MPSPVNKIARKRAENLLKEMFQRGTLRGSMAMWSMDGLFPENYEKGSSAGRKMYNRIKKEYCGVQCK